MTDSSAPPLTLFTQTIQIDGAIEPDAYNAERWMIGTDDVTDRVAELVTDAYSMFSNSGVNYEFEFRILVIPEQGGNFPHTSYGFRLAGMVYDQEEDFVIVRASAGEGETALNLSRFILKKIAAGLGPWEERGVSVSAFFKVAVYVF